MFEFNRYHVVRVVSYVKILVQTLNSPIGAMKAYVLGHVGAPVILNIVLLKV